MTRGKMLDVWRAIMRIDDLSAFIQAHKLVSGRSCPEFVPSDLCPEEFDWNVTRIQPYYKRVRRRCENGR